MYKCIRFNEKVELSEV